MNVCIGIPTIDTVPPSAFYHHMLLAVAIGRTAKVCIPPCIRLMPHDRARAFLFDCAVKAECDYLFFIDEDMIIPTDAFCSLMDVMVAKHPVAVSGHYYRRGYPYTCVWSKKIGDDWCQLDAVQGVHEIHTSGLGCCLVDVHWVRQNLQPPYFTMGVDEKASTVTDDISFFERIRSAGGKLFGHAGVRCGHLAEPEMIFDENVVGLRQRFLQAQERVAEHERMIVQKV